MPMEVPWEERKPAVRMVQTIMPIMTRRRAMPRRRLKRRAGGTVCPMTHGESSEPHQGVAGVGDIDPEHDVFGDHSIA